LICSYFSLVKIDWFDRKRFIDDDPLKLIINGLKCLSLSASQGCGFATIITRQSTGPSKRLFKPFRFPRFTARGGRSLLAFGLHCDKNEGKVGYVRREGDMKISMQPKGLFFPFFLLSIAIGLFWYLFPGLTPAQAETSARSVLKLYSIENQIDFNTFVLSEVSSTPNCPWVFDFVSDQNSVRHIVRIYLDNRERYQLHRMIEKCATQSGVIELNLKK
jgi:hypothetical protein